MPTIVRLDHLVLTVADIERTLAFYTRALGMTATVFGAGRHALRFGEQKLNLHLSGREVEPKASAPTPGSVDLCLITDDPIADWQAHFDRLGIAIELGPVRRTGALGPILSLYLRDPDRNLIEVSSYHE